MYSYLPRIDAPLSDKKAKEIKKLIKKNKLSFLTHFTHIDNLRSIIQFGILPPAILKTNRNFSSVRYNSISLPPGWERFVSLNLSFPDNKLLMQLQNHQPSEWIILLIDIRVIYEFPCYFFPERANDCICRSPLPGQFLDQYADPKDLAALFEDQGEVKRKALEIPPYYPTNPGTEILSSFPISPAYISQIHFYSDYKFNQWVLSNTEFALSQDKNRWACGLQYYSPRSDYMYWKTVRPSS